MEVARPRIWRLAASHTWTIKAFPLKGKVRERTRARSTQDRDDWCEDLVVLEYSMRCKLSAQRRMGYVIV